MTCHIALTCPAATVVLSDAQLSDATTEFHNVQKAVAGEDYIVAAAGLWAVCDDVLRHVHATNPAAADVATSIEARCEERFRASAIDGTCWLIAAPAGVRVWRPSLQKTFGDPRPADSIGSGSEFVYRAQNRDRTLRLAADPATLGDTLVHAFDYARESDMSLTVDDRYLVAFLVGGRSYMLGDGRISPVYAAAETQANWPLFARAYEEIRAICETIVEEYRVFLQSAREVRSGVWTARMEQSRAAVVASEQANHAALDLRLRSFMAEYDAALGRP